MLKWSFSLCCNYRLNCVCERFKYVYVWMSEFLAIRRLAIQFHWVCVCVWWTERVKPHLCVWECNIQIDSIRACSLLFQINLPFYSIRLIRSLAICTCLLDLTCFRPNNSIQSNCIRIVFHLKWLTFLILKLSTKINNFMCTLVQNVSLNLKVLRKSFWELIYEWPNIVFLCVLRIWGYEYLILRCVVLYQTFPTFLCSS